MTLSSHQNTTLSVGSSPNGENSLSDRAYELAVKLFDKNNALNLDSILDSLQSIYFELKNSNVKSSGYEYYCKRFQDAIDSIHQCRVNINDFEQLKLLGQGGFGKVELVRHKTTNNIYAMKTMNKSLLLRSNQSAFFLEERHIMALSNSPWLVKLHYAFISKDDIYMVMDFMQGGDLINLMSCYDIPLGWAKFYAAEASIAINALHDFGFIHLDVKPDNMLLDKSGHLKLCDFGTCVNVRKDGIYMCNFAVGTPDYISPEMLSSHNKPAQITKATDWWSYAVFLYELLFEETPFASDSLIGTYTKIANFKSSLKFPDETSTLKPACNLISQLLVAAEERPGFDTIKNDPFFLNDEWNFDNIRNCRAVFVPEIKDSQDTTHFDISDSTNVSNVTPVPSKSTAYSRVGGDHLNFVGFSFNPSIHEIGKYFDNSQAGAKLNDRNNRKSTTEDFVELEIDEFKGKLVSYQKLLSEIENQNKELLQSKNDVSIQLQNVSLQLQQASEKNQELQLEFELQLSNATENNTQTREYISQISNLTSQIAIEQEKCRKLENEKAKFELKYNDFEHSSMTLRKNYGGVEKKLQDLKEQYEKSLAEMDRLSTELQQEKQHNLRLKTLAVDKETKSSSDEPVPVRKLTSNTSDLVSPAVLNRTAIMRVSFRGSRDNVLSADQCESESSVDKVYLKTEMQHLKEALKQSTENECKIKNDLRLVTNENERLKQELQNTVDNIKNNVEFVEMEHRCKSLQSYVNLYKKQVRDVTFRVELLQKESTESKTTHDKQVLKVNQLETDLKTTQIKCQSEISKSKELCQEVALNKSNHTFQLSELQKQQTATVSELETTRKNLFEHENKVIDLTKTIANLSIASNNSTLNNTSLNENDTSIDATTNKTTTIKAKDKDNQDKDWQQMYNMEKMKKDQAIKKLDEMIFLFNKKGKTLKPTASNTTVSQDAKNTKKLQMELRNERLRYEKLLLEKQAANFEYSEALARLEHKINRLKGKNEELHSFIRVASNAKDSVTSMSSPLFLNSSIHNESVGDDHDQEPPIKFALNTISCGDRAKHSTSHGEYAARDSANENDPFYSTISTFDESGTDASHSRIQRSGISSFHHNNFKPSIHFEGYIWLIPYNKMKRSTRKLPWKKYYAVLTVSHFIVYTEKVDKENPKKIFKKIPLGNVLQAMQINHNDLRKADPKDIIKIFCVKYYDTDLADATTKLTSKSNLTSCAATAALANKSDKNSTETPYTVDHKGHRMVMAYIDNEPFCGSCSLNLSLGCLSGEPLHKCYVCKYCNLKFHLFHITTNDNTLSECSKLPRNLDSLHPNIGLNNNFVIDMFILSSSIDERTRWLYSFNSLAHITKSVCDINDKSNSTVDEPADNSSQSKLKKRSSLLSKLGVSTKTKGFSHS